MKKIAFSIPEELDERLRAYIEREFKGVKGSTIDYSNKGDREVPR